MFGLFSKLLKKSVAKRQDPPAAPTRPVPQEAKPNPFSPPPPPAPAPASAPKPARAPVAASTASAGGVIKLPLGSILGNIPKEFQGKTTSTGVAGLSFSVAIETIMEQLATGAVRIPFGELRRGAPAGVFVNSAKHDGQLIALPFAE